MAFNLLNESWAYDTKGDWCKKGVAPWWYGRHYPDGRRDGFQYLPDGRQELCYNETDCKINWQDAYTTFCIQ